MNLKLRIKESIERKIRLSDLTYNYSNGLLEPSSLFDGYGVIELDIYDVFNKIKLS